MDYLGIISDICLAMTGINLFILEAIVIVAAIYLVYLLFHRD